MSHEAAMQNRIHVGFVLPIEEFSGKRIYVQKMQFEINGKNFPAAAGQMSISTQMVSLTFLQLKLGF